VCGAKRAALAGDPAGKIEPSVVSDGAGAAKVAETETDLTPFRCISYSFADIQNMPVASA